MRHLCWESPRELMNQPADRESDLFLVTRSNGWCYRIVERENTASVLICTGEQATDTALFNCRGIWDEKEAIFAGGMVFDHTSNRLKWLKGATLTMMVPDSALWHCHHSFIGLIPMWMKSVIEGWQNKLNDLSGA